MKPIPYGKPGFLRVDSVHQGDKDGEKGVYHINLVDEVTQWELIGCVPQITDEYMEPLLDPCLMRFHSMSLTFILIMEVNILTKQWRKYSRDF